MPRPRLNLIGQKFGRLTVIEFICVKKKNSYFLCKCNCGNEKVIKGQDLKTNQTKSCGCLVKENRSKGLSRTHGMSKTQFYHTWNAMKGRCQKPNDKNYKHYGGRGITVCERWLKFENFRDDMYESYKEHYDKYGRKNTQIDRIKNDGDYKLSNCQWATKIQNQNNRRNNHFLTYEGQTLTISQWAKIVKIKKTTIYMRKNYFGLSDKETLTRPLHINRNIKYAKTN